MTILCILLTPHAVIDGGLYSFGTVLILLLSVSLMRVFGVLKLASELCPVFSCAFVLFKCLFTVVILVIIHSSVQ